MVCQWNLNLWELSGSVCGFTGASVNSKERLGARVGLCNFVGASGIFGSVCEMYCTKKITPWKNFSFSLHEQDQGAEPIFFHIPKPDPTRSWKPYPSAPEWCPWKFMYKEQISVFTFCLECSGICILSYYMDGPWWTNNWFSMKLQLLIKIW